MSVECRPAPRTATGEATTSTAVAVARCVTGVANQKAWQIRDTVAGKARQHMRNEFTAVIERDDEWYIAYCPEIPGANGQGRTAAECRASLAEAIALILDERRSEGLRGVPSDAVRETVTVG
jgi:predicted RNase H-like HicB family nuclease